MGNCLVTKLKGVVDNPDLKEFGFGYAIVEDASLIGVHQYSRIEADTIKTFKISGATFKDGSTEKSIRVLGFDNLPDTGAYVIKYPKYNLQRIDFVSPQGVWGRPAITFETEEIKYSPNLNAIVLVEQRINGKLSDLANISVLSYLNIRSVKGTITGTLNDLYDIFSKHTNNCHFDFYDSFWLTGNLKFFLDRLAAVSPQGRTMTCYALMNRTGVDWQSDFESAPYVVTFDGQGGYTYTTS